MKVHSYVKKLMIILLLGFTACSGNRDVAGPGAVKEKSTAKVLLSDQQLTSDPNDQSQPAVAYDNQNHRYMTVWTDSRNTKGTDIYGQLTTGSNTYSDNVSRGDNAALPQGVAKTGVTLTPGADIVICNADGNQMQPKIAFFPDHANSANSRFLVVWTDSRNGYSQIYGRKINTDGTPDGPEFTISDHVDAGSFPGTIESPASLTAGNITVYDGGNVVTATGTNFVAAGLTSGCTITINGISYVIATVTADRLTLTSIYGTLQDNSGLVNVTSGSPTVTGIATSFPVGAKYITIAGVEYVIATRDSATQLTLATNYIGETANGLAYTVVGGAGNLVNVAGAHEAFIASTSLVGTGTLFETKQITPGNQILINGFYYTITAVADDTHITVDSPVSTGATVYETTYHTNQTDPDILFNPVTKKFVVTWIDTTSYDVDHSVMLRGAGCPNSVIVGYLAYPEAADNNMVISAEVVPATGWTVSGPSMRSRLASTGGWVDNGTGIISAGWTSQLYESSPRLAFNSSTGETYVAWSGVNENVSASVGYKLANGSCTYSGVSFGVSGKDAAKKVKVRRNSGLGLLVDYSFGVEVNSLTLATDPNTNRLLLAWEDNDGGVQTGKNIQGQLVDLTSFTNYGSGIKISSAAGVPVVGDQTSPAASFDNVNQRFLVTWEDARNQSGNISNIDIYSQFIDPQGNLSGGNSIVTVTSGNQLAPSVVFGDVYFRKFLIVWKDGTLNNNADIYAQLLEFSVAPQLVITDKDDNPILNGAINFGNVPTGSTLDIPIKLRNDGNSQLTISSMTVPDAPFSFVTPTPVTISPGTSYDVIVRFQPSGAGSFAGNTGNNFKTSINSNGGQAILYFSGNGVGINPLSITTTSLPDAGTTVTSPPKTIATLTAAGGVFPYTWSSTALPANIQLNGSTGELVQTGPVAADTYTITFTVKDNNNNEASRELTLKVGSVAILTESLPPWTQDKPGYSKTLTATVGPTYTWSIIAGSGAGTLSPVAGLTLNATSGVISGTPTQSGTFNFTVQARGDGGEVATKEFTLTVNPSLSILTSSAVAGVQGLSYSQLFSAAGGTAPTTWSVSGGALPPGLLLNPGTGAVTGIPTASRETAYTFTLNITDSTGASASRDFSILVNTALGIKSPNSGNGMPGSALLGVSYSYTFEAQGGAAPYSWSIIAGSLPLGLQINPFTGLVTGSPSALGTFSFTVKVDDVNGSSAIKTFSITVNNPVTIVTETLSGWTQDRAGYDQTLAATGGNGSYKWTITGGYGAGTLVPAPGLALDTNTGKITGTPTAYGSYTFTATATDGSSPVLIGKKNLTIIVNPPLAVSTTSLAKGIGGALYSQQLFAQGGTTPMLWSLAPGSTPLPSGLFLDNLTGIISGVPAVLSEDTTYPFTVQVQDASGVTVTKSLTITVLKSPPPEAVTINTATISDMKVAVPVSVTLVAGGGAIKPGDTGVIFTWTLTGGSLPTGIALNGAGGTLAGTPSQAGTYGFTLQATDAVGNSTSLTYRVAVREPLAITNQNLKSWDLNQSGYLETLTATGGAVSYTWSTSNWLKDGAAFAGGANTTPVAGLVLNTQTGTISGRPTSAGVYTFDVQVVDSGTPQQAITRQYSIAITSPMTIATDPATILPLYTGKQTSFTLTAAGGTAPVTWAGVNLPAGLTLNPSTGFVSGAPASAGNQSALFTATDFTGRVATKTVSFVIYQPVTVLTQPTLTSSTAGRPYSYQLESSGGSGDHSFAVTSGNLPSGVTLSDDGLLGGTPTVSGTFTFEITATDARGAKGAKTFTLVINPPLSISTAKLADGMPNLLYSQQIGRFGGTAPFLWAVSSGNLPPGVNLDAVSGILSGMPTASGTYSFSVTVTDSRGATKTTALTVDIVSAINILTDPILPPASVGATFNQQLTASGGRVPYTWSISKGAMPPGLTLDSNTGIIRGASSSPGTYVFIVKIVDADSRTAEKTLTISTATSSTPLSITTSSLQSVNKNDAIIQTLTAAGGVTPYTWSLESGALPGGLVLTSSGTIQGVATASGIFPFIVKVTDAAGDSTVTILSITVNDSVTTMSNVFFSNSNLVDGAHLSGDSFDSALINTTSPVTKTYWLKNEGTTPVTLSTVTLAEPAFSKVGLLPGTVLAAASSVSFTVTFTPTEARTYTDKIVINDATTGQRAEFALSGIGLLSQASLVQGSGTNSTTTIKSTGLSTNDTILGGLPFNKTLIPAGGAVAIRISNVQDSADVAFTVTFASLPTNPIFYKYVSGSWQIINPQTINPATRDVTFMIKDNGPLDSDPTAGSIMDPIVVVSGDVVNGTTTQNPTTTTPPPSSGGGGGGCFIATAAYGSYLDPHVMVLRNFRDNILLRTELGTAFVRFYYRTSPPVADFIREHDSLRFVTRILLTPLILTVKYHDAAAALFLVFSIGMIWRRKARKAVRQDRGC